MQAFLNHYQASSKRLQPKRFNCSTPSFKYHSSIIALNTFRASRTHSNRGCLSHTPNKAPNALKVGPSLNLDTRAVLFLIFSNHGWYSFYLVQFKISTRRRRNLSSQGPELVPSMHNSARPHKTQHQGSFLCSCDQEFQHF